jgi:signal transduction histidine kinase
MPVRNKKAPWWLLWMAFLAVVIGFVATSVVADRSLHSIDDAAVAIATNAAPSIVHLERARAELRALQQQTDLYVADAVAGRDPSPDALMALQKSVGDEVDAYLLLPQFPSEPERSREVRATTLGLDRALRGVMLKVAARDLRGAERESRTQLNDAANLANAALLSTVELNADRARQLALQIEVVRNRTRALTFGLEALTAVSALAVAFGVDLVSRRYAALLDQNYRATEERAAELEMFAGRVAHDILGPLSPIALAIDMTLGVLPEDAAPRPWLARAQSSIRRVKGIVDGLLEFARAGAKATPGSLADVGECIDDVAASLRPEAEQASIELQIDRDAAASVPVAVCCARDLLSTAIANLVRNAIKYLGDAPVRRVTLRTEVRTRTVKVLVEDTGAGVSPHIEATLFEPYVRAPGAKQTGIGLGLATVKRIIEAHGGTVGVSSASGQGACFWIELPRSSDTPASPADAGVVRQSAAPG